MAACGDDDDGDDAGQDGGDKRTIGIGFVGPLTGADANLGINVRDGMRVAIEEANEKSDKFTFELKPFDTRDPPTRPPPGIAVHP